MLKIRMLLITGVWMVILPYLGFPTSWKNILFTLSGLFVIFLGYLFFQKEKGLDSNSETTEPFDNFLESNNFHEEEPTQ